MRPRYLVTILCATFACSNNDGSAGGELPEDENVDPDAVRFFDISAPGQGSEEGLTQLSFRFQSSVIDAEHGRILVAGWSQKNNRVLELNCRKLDGSPCASAFVTLTSGAYSGYTPSALIDDVSAGHRLTVVTDDALAGALRITRCPLTETVTAASCVSTPLRDEDGLPVHGYGPSIALDREGASLIVAYGKGGPTIAVTRCALDGTGCIASPIELPVPHPLLALTIDDNNNRAVIAYSNGGIALAVCDLALTGCTTSQIAPGSNKGMWPAIAYDTASSTLFVATQDDDNGKPAGFYRCTDGTPYTCDHVDLAGADHGWTPALAVSGNKVLYATMNLSAGYFPWLFVCNVDGTSCAEHDWSGVNHPVNDSGYFPTVLAHEGRVHIVSTWLNQESPRVYVPVLQSGPLP
jgi:hypothetical protein